MCVPLKSFHAGNGVYIKKTLDTSKTKLLSEGDSHRRPQTRPMKEDAKKTTTTYAHSLKLRCLPTLSYSLTYKFTNGVYTLFKDISTYASVCVASQSFSRYRSEDIVHVNAWLVKSELSECMTY